MQQIKERKLGYNGRVRRVEKSMTAVKTKEIMIVKRNGNLEKFDSKRIKKAVNASAERVMVELTEEALDEVIEIVKRQIKTQTTNPTVEQVHSCVEMALEQVNPLVAKSYREYRDYKKDIIHILDEVYKKTQVITYIGDKDCANMDSALVTTQRCLIYNSLNKELYKKFFLTSSEIEACKDGYIYIHDMSARRDTMNCCLFDMARVLKDGFEMSNIWYTEPKSLQAAFAVMGDVIINTTAMQYGGFTVPEVDTTLASYAKKSFDKYVEEYLEIKGKKYKEEAEEYAYKKVERDCEQGYQGIEYKLNTVSSSRGDYPFVTFTFGIDTNPFARMITKTMLNVHKEGQGKKGFKKPTLFPKLVFLYDKKLHGEKGKLRDSFLAAISCSEKTMYPDYLSLTGEGYVPEMYKKYGRVVSPMGCRAFLSPWYEKGGMTPSNKEDKPVFIGRFNIGAISLHLPMILARAREEQKNFYDVLDYYLEMIRKIHIRTYRYLAKRKASTNPLAYCQGGFYGGNLHPEESIEPILKSSTASFGITALNELQVLYNGKSIVEDGAFAQEVLTYINKKTKVYYISYCSL